jgi:hypothetical protein
LASANADGSLQKTLRMAGIGRPASAEIGGAYAVSV